MSTPVAPRRSSCILLLGCLALACTSDPGGGTADAGSTNDDGSPDSLDGGPAEDAGRDGGPSAEMDAGEPDAGDGGAPEDAGTSWVTSAVCVGDLAPVDQLGEQDCRALGAHFGQCEGNLFRCQDALDEADCRARNCAWSDTPLCWGPILCGAASSTRLCELLEGCSVGEARAVCEGEGLDCSAREPSECLFDECTLDQETLTCTGDRYTCAELSLFACDDSPHCMLRWEDPAFSEPDTFPPNPFAPDDCRTHDDCGSGRWCDPKGVCWDQGADGAPCGEPVHCASGLCGVKYGEARYDVNATECLPAPDCSLEGCAYCRVKDGVPTCFDACEAEDKPCATCGCGSFNQYCDEGLCLDQGYAGDPCTEERECVSGRCGIPEYGSGEGSVCLVQGGDACYGTECERCVQNVCLATCDSQDDCDGYVCADIGDGTGRCLATCYDDESCESYDARCRGLESATQADEFVLVCVP